MIRSIAGSIARPLAVAITGASGGAAPADTYAANGFSPDYVADFSAASADYFRVAGSDSDFETAFTSDSEGGGLAVQNDSSGNLVWRAHNLVLNSATPATQSITVVSGADYTVEITGSGSVALTGAGTGTVTAGNPVQITASTTTLTLTVTGSPSTMWAYRSDLGGMADNPDPVATGLEKYVPTTTAARYLARRRHHRWDGSAYVPTCLHEPVGATNGLPYSTPDSNWDELPPGAITITENNATGIDGNTSASTITEQTTTLQHYISESVSSGTGNRVMWAIARVNSGTRFLQIRPGGLGTGVAWANFDLSGAGSVDSSGGTELVSAGVQEWDANYYLCWMSANYSSSPSAMHVAMSNASSELPNYTGDGTSGFDIAHCQIENGLLPSSPIITNGSTVTRTADTLKGKAASLPYSSTAISMAIAGRHSFVNATDRLFLSWQTDVSNRLTLYSNGADNPAALMETAGAVAASASATGTTVGVNAAHNWAARFVASSEMQFASAGSAATADTTSVPAMPAISANDMIVMGASGLSATDGTVDTIRLWDEDIAEAGIKEATRPIATGGTVTDSGGYRYHTFTGDGTLTVTQGGVIEYLIVAGGGGGGNNGGGGGAGGVLEGTAAIALGAFPVTIGAAGAGATSGVSSTAGGDSTFNGLTASGGGLGGNAVSGDGGAGGSGGGAQRQFSGGAGVSGQGFDGGDGGPTVGADASAGGGGGGASGVGQSGADAAAGDGGNGVEWPSGSGVLYGGGGGGGAAGTGTPGVGGSGGGGDGCAEGGTPTDGAANTGGGGGGGGFTPAGSVSIDGADGGSGIVIVRYPI